MPTYDFYCSTCDLKFEKFSRVRGTSLVQPCPSCQTNVSQTLAAPSGHHFSERGAIPELRGETGSYQVDYSTDLNVGRDAALRWEVVKDRESEKLKVKKPILDKIGVPDAKVAMKRNSNGDYAPMTRTEVLANAKLREEARNTLDKK